MYLCQRYTGKKLKEIGLHFGIRESGVSQACRRVAQKSEKDKKLKKKIVRLENQMKLPAASCGVSKRNCAIA